MMTNLSSKYHPFPSVPFLFSIYTYYLWFSISFQFQFQPIQSFSFPHNLNLSLLERIALQSRLSKIQDQVVSDFPNSISSQGDSSTTTNNNNNTNKEKDISRDLVLLFPGAGGPDVLTTELRNVIQQCDVDQNIRSQMLHYHPNNDHSNVHETNTRKENRRTVIVYDWSHVRGNLFTAAYDGQAVGDALSQCFNKYYRSSLTKEEHSNFLFRSLHIIGISVGAFAANQFLESCYQKNLSSKYRITYLDPFTSRGVTGNNYGRIHFGRLTKNRNGTTNTKTNIEIHAEHYMNTDDPVPSTNDALPNCQPFVYDITNVPERQSFVLPPGETNMHCWPVAYFARYGYEPSLRNDDDHRVVWCFDK